jgi:lysozyme
MKVTKISKQGIELIKKFEGLKLKPYLCSAGVPTIGYGNTFYENGVKVKLSDPAISQERADQLLGFTLTSFEKYVDSFCRDDISQSQFDALVSFCFNLGPNNLKSSTLLKKVNTNPIDESIRLEFGKWTKAGGRVLKGLVTRRTAEADLYFS